MNGTADRNGKSGWLLLPTPKWAVKRGSHTFQDRCSTGFTVLGGRGGEEWSLQTTRAAVGVETEVRAATCVGSGIKGGGQRSVSKRGREPGIGEMAKGVGCGVEAS